MHEVLADDRFQPTPDGTTYCNLGIYAIALGMGVGEWFLTDDKKRPMLANEIWAKCHKDEVKEVSFEEAHNLASQGKFCFCVFPGAEHGHVAAVYPMPVMVKSGKWDCPVVFVCNIGKENAVMPANWAFREKPSVFVL
jgi:hypothetical protein